MFSVCKCIYFIKIYKIISVIKVLDDVFRMSFCDILIYFFAKAMNLCKFAKEEIKMFHAYTESLLWQENFIL